MLNKLLLCLITAFTILLAEGIEGDYRLSGLGAVDYDFTRQTTNILINDNYGLGIQLVGDQFLQGELIQYSYNEPLPEIALMFAGVILYVTFTEDGQALITEGSTYPNDTTENCVTTLGVLPVTGSQGYSVDLNAAVTVPISDIIGLPSMSPYQDNVMGSFSISQSDVFDMIPSNSQPVSIPFPIDTSSVTGNAGEPIPANTVLPGYSAGYVMKSTEMQSMIQGNPDRPSLYLEWHAIDGPINQSGLGDIIGEDEDGDGTDYDSIFGLQEIRVTKLNLSCGNYNYPIAGQKTEALRTLQLDDCIDNSLSTDCDAYADDWIDECINADYTTDVGEYLYAFSSELSNWGGFYTWNSYYELEGDDSDHDFNPDCLDNPIDCSGRLVFDFSPQCVPSFNVRYFIAEMIEECEASQTDNCGICYGNGEITWYADPDENGYGNPLDTIESCLQPEGYSYNFSGDINSDEIIDILDIVVGVNIIMGFTNPVGNQLDLLDVNGDGQQNVIDLVTIVSIILNA